MIIDMDFKEADGDAQMHETGLIQNSKCYLRCNLIAGKWNERLRKETIICQLMEIAQALTNGHTFDL
ncbi:hypothetical protein LINPERHAP2_LOCUS35586 [Linum perenne]